VALVVKTSHDVEWGSSQTLESTFTINTDAVPESQRSFASCQSSQCFGRAFHSFLLIRITVYNQIAHHFPVVARYSVVSPSPVVVENMGSAARAVMTTTVLRST
jgi:hypothetical protein